MGNIEFAAITSQHQTDKSEVPNSEALDNGEICHVVSSILILGIFNRLPEKERYFYVTSVR